MTTRSRRREILHVAMVSAAALAFVTGCDTATSTGNPPVAAQQAPPEEEVVSCGYEENGDWVVLPADACDDDGDGHGGGGFIGIFSTHGSDPHRNAYTTPGSRLPRASVPLKGAPIRWNDAGARSAAGLPASGKVATGPRTTFNSGVGKGASPGGSNPGANPGGGGKSGGS